jgi:hypothetical protein
MRTLILLLLLAASTASAEGLAPWQSIQQHTAAEDHPYVLAINEPFGWKSGFAIAGSAYVGLSAHQALRLNLASYDYNGNLAGELIGIFVFGTDGSEAGHRGRLLDVSAGWMYFPRKLWDGPTFEAGLLHRSVDTTLDTEDELIDRDGQMYAVRALLGWSWLIKNRVVVSFAMGASKGYTFGTETTKPWNTYPDPPMTTTVDLGEWTTGFEGYVRLGWAFGGRE